MYNNFLKISYFSYKGGSGRSSLAYNTIPFLVKELNASSKHPIIVVDLDVDSAGLSYLLVPELIGKKKTQEKIETSTYNGLIEEKQYITTNALIDLKKRNLFDEYDYIYKQSDDFNQMPLKRLFCPIGKEFGLEEEEDNTILFIPANPNDKVGKFDEQGNDRIEKFVTAMENYNAAAIIFDMPSGDQLLARIVMQECDKVVLCMRITEQHRIGTLEYLRRNKDSIEGVTFIPVPNAVPRETLSINGTIVNFEHLRDSIRESLNRVINEESNQTCDCDFGMFEDGYFGIPEVTRFKFKEGILFKDRKINLKLSSDEEKAIDAFERVARLLVKEK